MRTIETTLPWVRVGAGCAWKEWHVGVCYLHHCRTLSFHFLPFYVWIEVGQ